MNRRIKESMAQQNNVSELVNRWPNEWINESVKQWIVSEWRMVERMNERMDGWVSYSFVELQWQLCWTTALLSYCFVELLLCWATSSPSDLFALVSATSSLNTSYLSYLFPDPDLICPPASSSVASATRFFSSRSGCNAFSHFQLQSRVAQAMVKSYLSHSCYNAFSNLQLQSRLPGGPQHHSCFTVVLMRFATTGCKPTQEERRVAQRQQRGLQDTNPGLLQTCQLWVFFVKPSSRYSLVHIFPTSSSKIAPINRALAACALFVDKFSRSRPGTAQTETLLWRATPGATIPVKTRGFATESVFTREFTRFRTVTLPYYLMMGLTWWCSWHDDGVDMMMGLTWWWWCEC